MIGFFDYTVWLTYLSLLSGGVGIYLALAQNRIYAAAICLMLSGFMDAFDGKVARTKKDRTQTQKDFGIQIDSLTDLVAFGVLPFAIGNSIFLQENNSVLATFGFIVSLWFILAGLIRLAYFNVLEQERQNKEGGVNKFYTGLPITTSCLIFPTILLIQHITGVNAALIYSATLLIVGLAFVLKIRIKKAGTRVILILCGVGLIEIIIALSRGIQL